MNEQLQETGRINLDRKLSVANAIASSDGEIKSMNDCITKLGMKPSEVVQLFNDDEFMSLVAEWTKARNNASYHLSAIPRLHHIVEMGGNKEALTAIKLLGQLTDNLKNGKELKVTLNLEDELGDTKSEANGNFFDLSSDDEDDEFDLDDLD